VSSYSYKIFNKLIHVAAHLFIVLYYKRLTLWSHKLTWSFLQSVLVCFAVKAITFIIIIQDKIIPRACGQWSSELGRE